MNKNTRTLLILAGLAVAAYLAFRWYENRQNAGTTNSPTGALGTNLNSVAPELVGGSSGPEVGPALSTPINITLNENIAPPPADKGGSPMVSSNNQTAGALDRQGKSASEQGEQDRSPAAREPESTPDRPETTIDVKEKKPPVKRTARPRPRRAIRR